MTENELREIEEMANMVLSTTIMRCKYDCKCRECKGKCQAYQTARELINAGCRKIPYGAVVLTKDEYDALLADSSERSRQAWTAVRLDVCEQIQQAYTDARKETAREILQRIFNKDECGDLGEFCGTGWIYDIDEANAIFKAYGVEVNQ